MNRAVAENCENLDVRRLAMKPKGSHLAVEYERHGVDRSARQHLLHRVPGVERGVEFKRLGNGVHAQRLPTFEGEGVVEADACLNGFLPTEELMVVPRAAEVHPPRPTLEDAARSSEEREPVRSVCTDEPHPANEPARGHEVWVETP